MKPVPTKASSTFFAQLDRVLHVVSTPTRLEMLTAVDKWRLLLEILLGHPPIRGRSRPRDFPFAPHQNDALQLARSLTSREVPSTELGGPPQNAPPYRLYEWVVACALLGFGETNETDAELRISVLLDHLEFKLTEPRLANRARGLLGLYPNDIQPSLKRGKIPREMRKDAVIAAVIARHATKTSPGADPNDAITNLWPTSPKQQKFAQQARDRLEQAHRWRIDLKAAKVQMLLESCRATFIRRGASTWCAQTLAILRDDLCYGKPADWLFSRRPVLLVDSNALVSFWLEHPIDTAQVVDGVRASLQRAVAGRDTASLPDLAQRYPRLAPFCEEAKGLYAKVYPGNPDRQRAALNSVFPDIKVTTSKRSLWELATTTTAYRPDFEPSAGSAGLVKCFGERPPRADQTCSGRPGDPPMESRVPPWFSHGRDRQQQYGWPSFAYSLAGRVYHSTADRGLRLLAPGPAPLGPGSPQSARARLLAIDRHRTGTGERLVLLKIDGDRVGRHFIERPLLSRPTLSVAIESLMLEQVTRAVTRMTEASELDREQREQLLPPIDLIYFGGDDLELILPKSLFATFLESFSTPLSNSEHLPTVGQMSWSMAGIEFSGTGSTACPHPEFEAANLLGPLLDLAKCSSPFRNAVPPETPKLPPHLPGLLKIKPQPSKTNAGIKGVAVFALLAQLDENSRSEKPARADRARPTTSSPPPQKKR